MNTFLNLNRDKLKPIFMRVSLVFLGFVCIVLAIAYFSGNLPNGQLLFGILLTTGIGFPILVLFIGYIVWTLNHKARQKAFSKPPFNNIESIGFYKGFIDDSSKWALTEEIKEGKLNGFTLKMDMSREKGRHTIEFETAVEWMKLDKSEYNLLTEKFKQYHIEFRIGSLVKQYNTKRPILKTVADLEEDLKLFTTLLRQEGFIPKME